MFYVSPFVHHINCLIEIKSHQNGLEKDDIVKSLQNINSISNFCLSTTAIFYYYLVDQMMGTVKADFQKHLQNLQAAYLLTSSEYESIMMSLLEYCDQISLSLSSKEFAKNCFDLCNLFPIEQSKLDLFCVCCCTLALRVKQGYSQITPSIIKQQLGGKYDQQEIQNMEIWIQQSITHQNQESSIELFQKFFAQNPQWKIYEDICQQILGLSMCLSQSRFVKPKQTVMSVFLACIELKAKSNFDSIVLSLEHQITPKDLVMSLKSGIVQLILSLNSEEIDCVDGSA